MISETTANFRDCLREMSEDALALLDDDTRLLVVDVELATEGLDPYLIILGMLIRIRDAIEERNQAVEERNQAQESLRAIGRKAFWAAGSEK